MNTITISPIEKDICFSDRLNTILKDIQDNTILTILSGEYYLEKQIDIINKKNLTIECQEGCVFIAKFDRTNGGNIPTPSINAFYIEGCENFMFKGSIIKADYPTNVCGKIINVGKNFIDVQVNPRIPLDENCKFVSGMSFDETGCPTCGSMGNDYRIDENFPLYKDERIIVANELVCTNPPAQTVKTQIIGENTYRLYDIINMHVHKVGLDCTLYHTYYGTSAFIFRNSNNVIIDGVKIHNYGGMAFLVLTRCMDFTFKNIVIDNPDKTHSIMSTQSDAIHTLGLGGTLVLDNILFDHTSDDCLNVHSQILTFSQIENNRYKVIYNKKKGIVSNTWAKKGDKLYIYNPENLAIKGEAIVESYENGYVTFTPDSDLPNVGDLTTNCIYMPKVSITNCTLKNCVGQFKIKSCTQAMVSNCTFDNGVRGVNISTFLPTLEGGPVQNVTVENNTFINILRTPVFAGFIKDFSEYSNEYNRIEPPIIQNVVIRNNIFKGIKCKEIMRLLAVDGLTVENNTFMDCADRLITIKNCKNVKTI